MAKANQKAEGKKQLSDKDKRIRRPPGLWESKDTHGSYMSPKPRRQAQYKQRDHQ